ncbi:alpha/beta fold hydrolase [Nonomuraea sp. NPDC005650]|uniref:esterase/lipase family protein n=1 Tax=Nonomuraea sp. NPDC005650 TaxID=3157045 RepID=UPI0033A8389C
MKRLMWVVVTVMVLSLESPASAGASGPSLPVLYSGVLALAHASLNPGADPAGANDWACRPSAAHPRPVVLVHGTLANMTITWFTLSPLLRNQGYCVFAFNYGQEGALPGLGLPGASRPGGVARVDRSAGELAAFVDRVLRATGAREVDVVGHSQGGMMPRYYLKFLGGARKVGTLVGLAPPNHGTTIHGLSRIPGVPELIATAGGQAVRDQIAGSALLRRLNEGGDTVPGVRYTVIASRLDGVVTPYASAFLDGPRVTDIVLQKQCPLNISDHLAIAYDARALHLVTNALDPAHATPVDCRLTLPVNGG